ncbi:hypothetical protein R5R35_004727 [Gryllus longicercus]|uniref:PAXIP1-associated glutamate-rich protein 1 n=1 Tax=Gryllus longicercus TaxID=2509291 RepID=A0AAN9VE06_9ORTH|nr:uncharacterized protein GBIM_16055 [Gryllus bimaculatus]
MEKPDNGDWIVRCSDEEYSECEGEWEPPPEEIIRLYELLDQKAVPNLEWKCPGRRAPSPAQDEFYHEDEESLESKPEEKSDFDFMDEMSSPKLPVRRGGEGGPKGSAKKKTTSLDDVLSNMRRHRKLEQLEKQASNCPPCSSPS